MKQSKVTGAYIFRQITSVKSELAEIDKALDVIDNELGRSNVAYGLIKKQQEDKLRELKKLENAEYLEPVQAPVISPSFVPVTKGAEDFDF